MNRFNIVLPVENSTIYLGRFEQTGFNCAHEVETEVKLWQKSTISGEHLIWFDVSPLFPSINSIFGIMTKETVLVGLAKYSPFCKVLLTAMLSFTMVTVNKFIQQKKKEQIIVYK